MVIEQGGVLVDAVIAVPDEVRIQIFGATQLSSQLFLPSVHMLSVYLLLPRPGDL